MSDFNNGKIERLLFTEEPFDDESFIGYVLRLAQLNHIPDFRWILKFAGLNKPYDYKYKYNSDFRVDQARLSDLTGTSEERIINLLYLHEQGRRRHIVGDLIVFNQPIRHFYVVRERPKICPKCLTESNYCRKIWELSPVTACPAHRCLLIQNCRSCGKSISWSRAAVNLCKCGFDFRRAEIELLNSNELQISRHIYQEFRLPCSFQKHVLKYPLNTLTLRDLLKLLFFIAGLFDEILDYEGATISKSKNNREIHSLLFRALKVFDDWAINYYALISQLKKQNIRHFIICKQFYSSKVQLSHKHSDYESFNQILHNILFEDRFSFMHLEFQKYLMRLPYMNYSSH